MCVCAHVCVYICARVYVCVLVGSHCRLRSQRIHVSLETLVRNQLGELIWDGEKASCWYQEFESGWPAAYLGGVEGHLQLFLYVGLELRG